MGASPNCAVYPALHTHTDSELASPDVKQSAGKWKLTRNIYICSRIKTTGNDQTTFLQFHRGEARCNSFWGPFSCLGRSKDEIKGVVMDTRACGCV